MLEDNDSPIMNWSPAMASRAKKAPQAESASADPARTALIISGGAPNATLMAGALAAFDEQGVSFDVISTAGAGALLGLMYCAPKTGTPRQAMESLIEMGVADPLYDKFPVNFKVFNKPGMMADLYRNALGFNPFWKAVQGWQATDPASQLLKDSLELAVASACPTDLNSKSLGLCAHVPFAEEVIDFSAIAGISLEFYVNAFNLTQKKIENFSKEVITPLHLQASLSFPFLYPPTQIGEDWYIEGASIDCLNFHNLLEKHPNLERIVVFDILGADKLLRAPRDLYDAWVMSIITPLVEIARDDLKIFEAIHLPKYPKLKDQVLRVPLLENIPAEDMPDVFDWSRSNLTRLYDIGYRTGMQFVKDKLAVA